MTDKVMIEKDKGAGFVIINRPDARNALDNETTSLLITGLKRLDSDDDVNVIVLKSSGDKAFCAGADMKEMAEEGREPGGETDQHKDRGIIDILQIMADSGKPVICSVQGYALGAGCGLVAGSDLAIASENAVFGLPEINLGFFPLGLLVPIVRSMGKKHANELIYTGKRITANEALNIGLINRVVPLSDLEKVTLELATFLAEKEPSAFKIGKKAISTIMDMEFNKSLEYCYALAGGLELKK